MLKIMKNKFKNILKIIDKIKNMQYNIVRKEMNNKAMQNNLKIKMLFHFAYKIFSKKTV